MSDAAENKTDVNTHTSLILCCYTDLYKKILRCKLIILTSSQYMLRKVRVIKKINKNLAVTLIRKVVNMLASWNMLATC